MLGAVVLAIAVVFGFFAYSSAQFRTVGGYEITARFDRVEGTQAGGDVRISGIKVGTILSQELDPKTFQAVLHLNIQDSIKLPVDTVASITSAGLLGEKFLSLEPGADDKTIDPGGQIRFTQPPISLESLLGQAVFSLQGGGNKQQPVPESASQSTRPAAGDSMPSPSAPPLSSKP